MDLKDYKPTKKIDINGWLVKGNAGLYAFILIVFVIAVIFVFSTVSTMFHNEQENDVLPTESSEEETTSVYVEENQSYMLAINKLQNYLVVYKMDTSGEFTNVYKVMRCSVPKDMKLGETKVTEKFIWKRIEENVYGHYTMQLDSMGYIHSVPYTQQDVMKLIVKAYNQLGKEAVAGCVSLAAGDAKWIYENCGLNTVVKIYEDSKEKLGSELKELETLAEGARFDPTDKEAASNADSNIVNTKIKYMTGTRDCTVALNEPFDLWAGVNAKDINGNDITSYITAEGSVDTSTPGVYLVKYYLSDSFGTNLKYYRYVTVTDMTSGAAADTQSTQGTTATQSTQGTQNTVETQDSSQQQATTDIHSGLDYTQQSLPETSNPN